jgi:uncharacterized phage-like protein YoqJ
MIVAGTGHRPNKLGGYTVRVERMQEAIAYAWLSDNHPEIVISGMALGWDQALARAAIARNVRVIAALPFENHHSIWPHWQIEKYTDLLSKCYEVKIVCNGGYEKWKMQKRNEWMVDNCDLVLALWDGSTGGTNNCIQYAISKQRKYVNLWDKWNAASDSIQV